MKKILRFIFSALFAGLMTLGVIYIQSMEIFKASVLGKIELIYLNKEIILFILFFALMYFTITIPISKVVAKKLEEGLSKYPMQEILMYIIGLGIGLYVASLATNALKRDERTLIGDMFVILLYFALGFFGMYLVHMKKQEIKGWLSKKGDKFNHIEPKILDTSVIIDGRILDIISTGFVEGKVIIPSFVLDELRHIADSSDLLKRNRGRRGLDILNELKNIKLVQVEVMEIDYPDISEVDSKLLRLASEIEGKVVTNDFNLNKVAKLQRIQVLNINDLANAIKQVVLPNEEMQVTVVKEGKEQEQGLAYLNDGTMIVVENGKKYIGLSVKVKVATVLQTSAGRMIFAKVMH